MKSPYLPRHEQECRNCHYWMGDRSENAKFDSGFCQRYAPRPSDHDSEACWPQTLKTEWCGEWCPLEEGQ